MDRRSRAVAEELEGSGAGVAGLPERGLAGAGEGAGVGEEEAAGYGEEDAVVGKGIGGADGADTGQGEGADGVALWEFDLGVEEDGGGVVGEGDLGGEGGGDGVGAAGETAPLKPEAEGAFVAVAAEVVGEFAGVAAGEREGASVGVFDLDSPEEALGGGLLGVDELGVGFPMDEGEDGPVGCGKGQPNDRVGEDEAVALLTIGGAGLGVVGRGFVFAAGRRAHAWIAPGRGLGVCGSGRRVGRALPRGGPHDLRP